MTSLLLFPKIALGVIVDIIIISTAFEHMYSYLPMNWKLSSQKER